MSSLAAINNPDDRIKLKSLRDDAVKVLQEVHDLRGGLRDTVKAIAEDLEIEPKLLNKMISLAFKEAQNTGSVSQEEEVLDDVKALLEASGGI